MAVAVVLYGVTAVCQQRAIQKENASSEEKKSSLFPSSFFKTHDPQIENAEVLKPFFIKLNQKKKPVRIVHIGDSHVRGHVFTVAAREALENALGSQAVENQKITYQTTALARETGKPGLVYHAIGVNGATCQTFCTSEMIMRISTLKPDLIILSFGTNESIGSGYTDDTMRAGLDSLVSKLHRRNPSARFLLTTPPGCYFRIRTISHRRGRRICRYSKSVNTRIPRIVSVEKQFAKERKTALFDIYGTCGGDGFALRNWERAGMMRGDGVHFTYAGYQLMGKLLAQAMLSTSLQ